MVLQDELQGALEGLLHEGRDIPADDLDPLCAELARLVDVLVLEAHVPLLGEEQQWVQNLNAHELGM